MESEGNLYDFNGTLPKSIDRLDPAQRIILSTRDQSPNGGHFARQNVMATYTAVIVTKGSRIKARPQRHRGCLQVFVEDWFVPHAQSITCCYF